MLQLVLFIVGLGLLLAGGHSLVYGAAKVARVLGVPPVVVGLTVIAFGTSVPELAVAVIGTTSGAGEIAFGNAIGACITNIALVLGLSALFRPLDVETSIVTRELPMLLLASTAALVVSIDEVFGSAINRIDRSEGLMLCLVFSVFVYYSAVDLRRGRQDFFATEARSVGAGIGAKAIAIPLGFVVLGSVFLPIGGDLLVSSALGIAEGLGITPAGVALTIVSLGTTSPELVTSLLAIRKGETGLAVGGIVGSNIFNLLAVLGIAALLNPIDVPVRGLFALALTTSLTLILLMLVGLQSRRFDRTQGALLLVVFIAYNLWIMAPIIEAE